MKMTFNLMVVKYNDEGDIISSREPTLEEVKKFLNRLNDIEDKGQDRFDGELWFVDEEGIESFDFEDPHGE